MTRPMIGRGLVAVLVLSTALVGCGERSAPVVTVTDSAGVRFTLSHDQGTVYADVSGEAEVSLGGQDDAGPTQFFRVQKVYVDPEERLWVADGQSGEVRVFLPDGTPWKVVGGRGHGPGEFMSIRLLGPQSGDTVRVADDADGRVAVYDPAGDFVRMQRVESGDRPTPRLFDVFSDGSLLGQVPRILSAVELEPGRILRDSVDLVRFQADHPEWVPHGAGLGPLFIWTGSTTVPVPFTANASFDISRLDEVHLVSGSEFRVRVWGQGRLKAVYGVDRPPRQAGAADVDAYRRMVLGGSATGPQDDRQRAYLDALDHPARPAHLPAYARLLASPAGEIWVQRYESDLSVAPTWDVFGVDGRLLGSVTTPANLIVMSVMPDAIVGIWRDDVGIEHVRRYGVVVRGSG